MKYIEKMRPFAAYALCAALLTLSLSACPKKQTVKQTADDSLADQDSVESQELDIHGKDFVSNTNLETIRFEYDSADLQTEARDTLARNATYLKSNPDLEVLSEGHTDERGTVEYNIALGQKRSQSVRKYYISLGIDPKRVGSLSFGKEKPLCAEMGESCWFQNRRVETKVRSLKVANGHNKEKDPSSQEEIR